MMKKQSIAQSMCGFTLIEVMVVLVIITILVAIIVPSYEHYMIKTRRDVAKVTLEEVRSLLEAERLRTMTINGGAITDSYVAGGTIPPVPNNSLFPDGTGMITALSVTGYIRLNKLNNSARVVGTYTLYLVPTNMDTGTPLNAPQTRFGSYVIYAMPADSRQQRDRCGGLSLSSSGAKKSGLGRVGGDAFCW